MIKYVLFAERKIDSLESSIFYFKKEVKFKCQQLIN